MWLCSSHHCSPNAMIRCVPVDGDGLQSPPEAVCGSVCFQNVWTSYVSCKNALESSLTTLVKLFLNVIYITFCASYGCLDGEKQNSVLKESDFREEVPFNALSGREFVLSEQTHRSSWSAETLHCGLPCIKENQVCVALKMKNNLTITTSTVVCYVRCPCAFGFIIHMGPFHLWIIIHSSFSGVKT